MKQIDIVARPGLSAAETAEVRALQAACEAADGSDLKLSPVMGAGASSMVGGASLPTQFLAREPGGGDLVGYAGVDRGHDLEVAGMVDPGRRRRGVGEALLRAALGAVAALSRESALVICEDAVPQAAEWLRRRGGRLDSSELRMVLQLPPASAVAPAAPEVDLRLAVPGDRHAVVGLLGQGFSNMSEAELAEMVGEIDPIQDVLYLGRLEGEPVVTLRVYRTPGRAMVYGLVVAPGARGRGIGRAAMLAVLRGLAAGGEREVSLEVLPDNTPAVRLYRGLGFRVSTTYRYIRVDL